MVADALCHLGAWHWGEAAEMEIKSRALPVLVLLACRHAMAVRWRRSPLCGGDTLHPGFPRQP